MTDCRYLIVSFPRSGNHLVRALVEYAFHRPTLGCPGISNDTPIHEKDPNRRSGLIAISSPVPIAFKAHTLNCVWRHRREQGGEMKTVLILRDPVDAIASQLLRILDRPLLSERKLTKEINVQVSWYLQPVYCFLQAAEKDRFLLRFEDLVSADRGLQTATGLLRFMGHDGTLDAETWARIAGLARDSQESLGKVRDSRRVRIREAVAAAITGPEIDALIRG